MALLERYQTALEWLRTTASVGVANAWERLGSYDEADVPRFLEQAVPLVAATQSQSSALTAAYLAAELGSTPTGIDPALVTGAAVRAGVAPEVVYQRPFIEVWTKLKAGAGWQDAVNAGRARAAQAATTDVQLSMRATAQQVMSRDPNVVGYRRVLTGRSCAFCATASTQRYKRAELMPLHPACDCGVAPIVGNRDPGHVINKSLLASLKSRGGEYWKDRDIVVADDGTIMRTDGTNLQVAVREHGELGPTLVDRADHFDTL